MVHFRLNETEPNPNSHINFITALPMPNAQDSEEARQLLRALAAQVRPVMKAHGFTINSFEEYEYNAVFAGRNWNNGETIEIVLRRANGSYCPTSWLMSTLCHELAHIKHMNHGTAFQSLWARLRREVRQLQDKGYYGDGYWSSGTRLADSVRISGDGIETGDFPEYMCGGAQTRTRPIARRRRRARQPQDITPSLHTGRQTAKRRKAGGRVTSKFAFVGAGKSLAGDTQSSKGKRAASNRAREERALAAEMRLSASNATRDAQLSNQSPHEDLESDSDLEIVQETDVERRQALEESKKADVGEDDYYLGKGLGWKDFEDEFNFSASRPGSTSARPQHSDIIDLTDNSDMPNSENCDLPIRSGSTFTSTSGKSEGKKKEGDRPAGRPTIQFSSIGKSEQRIGLGLVQSEVKLRKQEALGLTPVKDSYRKLGQPPKVNPPRQASHEPSQSIRNIDAHPSGEWDCLVCTLKNRLEHLACEACATPRGESTYYIE